MSKAIATILFHGSIFAIFNFALWYHSKIPNNPSHPPSSNFAAKFKYLTFWNLIFQATAFGLCLASDLLKEQVSWHSKLVKLKDRFFMSVAIPFGLHVFITFWALFFIDRDLIFPKSMEAIYPHWLNHLAHTFIFFPLLLETKLFPHQQPTRAQGLRTVLGINLVYGVWVIWLALRFQLWVYPFLALLSWPGRFLFFLVSCCASAGLYFLGEIVNFFFWGPPRAKDS